MHYDTSRIAESERFDYWQGAVGALFPPAEVSIPRSLPFFGSIDRRDLGTLAIASIRSCAQRVRRLPRHIGRPEDEVFELNFQVAGVGFVAQDGREATSSAGQFVIYDSTRPYEMRFEDPFKQLTVKLPRAALNQRLWLADRLTAVNFSWRAGPGRLLFDFMRGLGNLGSVTDPQTLLRLEDHALDLLATALRDARATAREARSRAMLDRAQTFIVGNLGDPALSPRAVAESCGISVRTLYQLFAAQSETPGKWIQAARLDACRRDIEDPLQARRSITDIAFAWGFNDSAHFSRLFRSRYGTSPRAWSAAHRRR